MTERICGNGHVIDEGKELCARDGMREAVEQKPVAEEKTEETEVTTEELSAAGLDENTVLKTREEMVAEHGEEFVANLEKNAMDADSAESEGDDTEEAESNSEEEKTEETA